MLTFETICAIKAAENCSLSGVSVKDIAKQAGKSPKTVHRWLKTTNSFNKKRAMEILEKHGKIK